MEESTVENYPYTNRLINEKSPYLLQHAHNPVEWFAWNDEAFKAARHEDKPIFLSIGYATCHWCHVMEHESFEDEEVAALMNENYISIKVDREERPDVDNVYMSACQALTGGGGWPLSIFMRPDGKPFYAGTYFPKTTRSGMPGFVQVLQYIAKLWEDDRDRVDQAAEQITEALQPKSTPSPPKKSPQTVSDETLLKKPLYSLKGVLIQNGEDLVKPQVPLTASANFFASMV